VSDTLAASSTFSRTTQSFKDRELVGPLNLNSGEIRRVQTLGEIRTAQNDQASATSNPGAFQVTAQSGSSLVLWAQNRVVLKPGFRSMAGSVLWATVDANMNGYSDMEESIDSDGDGLFDAWEFEHGLNVFGSPNDPALVNSAGNKISSDTNMNAKTAPMPAGFQLVIRYPNNTYAGVRTSNWSITGISAP
jgi:hypothetical protein